MSLNGLDAVQVLEAHQAALAEAGGWFLLKYTSRDAVDILARGSGGAADVRNAIAHYQDQSPLYGFLLYRRRKLLIKYVPDGTSRLLQARVAVHFSAVTDKFTPYDTEIAISTADHLSDAALASACSLHTAAPSSSSSSSSSQLHKLDDITEDAEEGQSTAGESVSTAKPPTAVRSMLNIGESALESTTTELSSAGEQHVKVAEENSAPPSEPSSKDTDTVVVVDHGEDGGPLTAPIGKSFDHYDLLFEGGPDPRLSSQTARPALSDLYAEIYAQYNKPKVRLGPRPKASLETKRPHTSGTGAQSSARPVSSLPSGLRAANRRAAEQKQPNPHDASNASTVDFPPPPPIPAIPEVPATLGYAPKSSAASVKSLPANTYSSHNHRSIGVTPEKQRLMKALELRKKQMQAKKEKQEKKSSELSRGGTEGSAQENVNVAKNLGSNGSTVESVEEEGSKPSHVGNEGLVASQQQHQHQDIEPSNQHSSSPEDSALTDSTKSPPAEGPSSADVASRQTEADDLHSAASASSPTSAQTAGSSCAPSTRPSSVSEDDQQLLDNGLKLISEESVQAVDQKSREDEEESTESTPTVVPENSISIPSVEIAPVDQELQYSHVSEKFVSENKEEPAVPMATEETDIGTPTKKPERDTVLFVPPLAEEEPTQTGKRNRESMMLAAPNGFDVKAVSDVTDKRRVLGDPIHLSAENSETEYLSDDSFMEELQSAKVEEAMPVSVSKSPITPYFAQRNTASGGAIPMRSASQNLRSGNAIPDQPTLRKFSGPWVPHSQSDTVVTAKKINVSSGISQRIKALAEKSNRDSSVTISPLGTPESSTSIVAQRKSSFFATTPPSGSSPNGRPISRLYPANLGNRSTSPSPSPSRSPTPDVQRRIQPSEQSQPPPVYNVQTEPEKSQSVQVTARIVRDPQAQRPSLIMPTESTPLELRQSDITIDHQKTTRPPSSKQSPVKTDPPSPVRPPSLREASSGVPRSSSEISWRAFGRRMSESKQGASSPRSRSSHSMDSSDEKQDKHEKYEKKEKKESRASKLFKRMSTIPSSKSRKNSAASSTLSEEGSTPTLPSLREPPSPVQVGDLNIQFPDTLLWKRRWVEIDVSGNLVMSLSKSNEQSKGIMKRFHLSEFHAPYPPDQDRQELPNSVVFDFIDGRTLQCACETPSAQAHVLYTLKEAHQAWQKYNQGL
ncbi:unnamed protein product [Periconia digitata]|uniref:Uncharacterized protein n=1 Tax=Periconia digitata TaxID=1303443 RepID=A0A9W4URX8_9PLEO|nr:unnamed protein product [Periconia digitata]